MAGLTGAALRTCVVQSLREHLDEFREQFHVVSLELCGSVARDEADDTSDIDVLATFDASASLFDLVRLQNRLSDILDRRVDVLTRGGLQPSVLAEVERESFTV